MAASTSKKIDTLIEKRRALDARIQRMKSRDAATERKARSHALRLLGIAIHKQMQKHPAFANPVRQLIMEHLQQRDQETVIDFLFSPNSVSSDTSQSASADNT